MADRIPLALDLPPLTEAVCRLKFSTESSVVQLLPGIISKELEGRYKKITSLGDPGELPPEIVKKNPFLLEMPRVKLQDGDFAILVGENSVSVHSVDSYPGWGSFQMEIMKILDILQNNNMIRTCDSIFINYLDLFEKKHLKKGIYGLNIDVFLSEESALDSLVNLKLIEKIDDFKCSIEIGKKVSVKRSDSKGGKAKNGILVDTKISYEEQFKYSDIEDILGKLHNIMKIKFFSLIKEDSLKSMKPVYE